MGSLDDEPTGRLRPKKESSFGKPKDSWGFGKKPSNGSFGQTPSKGSFGKETVTLKSGRTKPKARSYFGKRKTKIKKYELALPSYMAWLHEENRGSKKDVHHWRTRSDIGRNDFFISMVDHDYHINVIHGKLSPRGFRDEYGEDNLHTESFVLFASWLADSSCGDFERGFFKPMLEELRVKGFENSVDIVRAYAEEYNYTTKNPHH